MIKQFNSAIDFRKSLESRLKTIHLETNRNLQRLRRQLAFDRLLARFFFDKENTPFLLKGGYAMELRFDHARSTKDIDFTYPMRFPHLLDDEITEVIFLTLTKYAQIDLHDFFQYKIGLSAFHLDGAPYGGARFPITSFIADRVFVKFHVDIGLDILCNKTEIVQPTNWLDFCGIPGASVIMISKEQQFAEKIHAYTQDRGGKTNSRVKDLVDLVLLIDQKMMNERELRETIETIFQVRDLPVPETLTPPPEEWKERFANMAIECELDPNINEAFNKLLTFYQSIHLTKLKV